MKTSSIVLLAFLGSVSAGTSRPQLSISLRDGKFDDFSGLEPSVSWEGSTQSGDIDVQYGVDLTARATTDVASLPKSIWGKASREISGWGVSARAEVKDGKYDSADLEVEANNADADLSVRLLASAGKDNGISVSRVEASKGIDTNGAHIVINPRFNVETEQGDVVIGYKKDNTEVEVTASQDDQTISVSQQLDDDNRVEPTFSRSGALSLAWEHQLGDGNSVTATLKPNESVNVEWKDASWTANINVPIDGVNLGGPSVSVKRDVTF